MMRENKIFAAGMNVNLLAQIFSGHFRAFDVPSRTSFAPRCIPERLAVFFRLPEYEIQRIFLFVLAGYEKLSSAGLQVIQIFMRQLSIVFETSCAEVNGSVLLIGMPLFNQFPDHLDHSADL